MPTSDLSYFKERENKLTVATREMLHDMPDAVRDFILAISQTTQPLTRYAYTLDLRLFFSYLTREIPRFGGKTATDWTDADLAGITTREIDSYLDYLSYYIKEDNVTPVSNQDMAKQRKLSSLRKFYLYLFKNGRIPANIMTLVDMPKRHEKPILRLEIDEVMKMLDAVESEDSFSGHQRSYNRSLRVRDEAILMLFLGTGIRVSELVGLDLQDIDFSVNGFLVTRKGGSQSILYFPEDVADSLRHYIEERQTVEACPGHENALFLSTQRKRIGVRSVENMVKKYAHIASPLKTRISPHKLRSTFGTNLYHETGDIYLVADALGHKDVNTTRRHYAAMSDDRRRSIPGYVKLKDAPDTPPAGASDKPDEN